MTHCRFDNVRTDYIDPPLVVTRFRAVLALGMALLFMVPLCAHAQDRLTIAVPYLPTKLDPGGADPVTRLIMRNIAAPIAGEGADLVSERTLATGCVSSVDGTRWTFELGRELRFASGQYLGAAELARAIQLSQELRAPRLVTDVTYDADPTGSEGVPPTVTVTLNRQAATSPPDALLGIAAMDPVLLESFGRNIGRSTLMPTLGAFYLHGDRPGAELTLRANANFFLRPTVGEIVLKVFADAAAALTSLRSGAVDMIAFPSPSQTTSASRDTTLAIYQLGLANYRHGRPRSERTENGESAPRWGSDETATDNELIARKSVELDSQSLAYLDFAQVTVR